MEALPPISVIVPSRNRPRLLLETVQSILACPEPPAEIVVVDQSDEPHPELAAAQGPLAPVTYRRSETRGLSSGRNAGVGAAAHDVLVFVDDDMFATPGWLRALVGPLGDSERAAVTGRVTAGEPERRGAAQPATAVSTEAAAYRGRQPRDVLAGGNLAITRSTLAEAGGWDDRLGPGTRFPSAEDNDLGFRLLELGCTVVFAPRAELVHRAWRPPRDRLLQRWRYGRGQGAFYAKQLRRAPGYAMSRLARDLGHRAARVPRALVRRPRLAASDAAFSLGLLAGWSQWLAERAVERLVRRR